MESISLIDPDYARRLKPKRLKKWTSGHNHSAEKFENRLTVRTGAFTVKTPWQNSFAEAHLDQIKFLINNEAELASRAAPSRPE